MVIEDIYKGLKMEPINPEPAVPQIHLRARIVDSSHFVFIPERWEQALKPFKKANWTHDTWGYSGGFKLHNPHNYELKRGNYLVFPQFFGVLDGGFYVARLYMVVKEMGQGEQAQGEFSKDQLVITQDRQRVTIRTNPMVGIDDIYHAVMENTRVF